MLKSLVSACRGPRALFLAGVVLALGGAVNPIRADVTLQVDEDSILGATMKYQLDGTATPDNGHIVGRLDLTIISGSAHFPNNSSPIYAFCLELTQERSVDDDGNGLPMSHYVEKTGLSGPGSIATVPKPGGGGNMLTGMGDLKAALLDKLFDSWFSTHPGGWDDFTGQTAAAFQLAIWEILYDGPTTGDPGDLDVQGGNFLVLNGNALQNGIRGLAQGFLDALSGPVADAVDLLAFSNNQGGKLGEGWQDLITVLEGGGTVQSAPVPPAIVMALAGLASLGGYGWRRRKQPIAA